MSYNKINESFASFISLKSSFLGSSFKLIVCVCARVCVCVRENRVSISFAYNDCGL